MIGELELTWSDSAVEQMISAAKDASILRKIRELAETNEQIKYHYTEILMLLKLMGEYEN